MKICIYIYIYIHITVVWVCVFNESPPPPPYLYRTKRYCVQRTTHVDDGQRYAAMVGVLAGSFGAYSSQRCKLTTRGCTLYMMM